MGLLKRWIRDWEKNSKITRILTKKMGIFSVGLLGNSGGKAKSLCDMNLTIKSNDKEKVMIKLEFKKLINL